MKLPRFRNPFRAIHPVIYTRYEGGKVSVEFEQLPCVMRVSLNYVERSTVKPEDLGYRMVCQDEWFFGAIYAKPLPVWLLCKAGRTVQRSIRRALYWLYDKHLIGYAPGHEAESFRWCYLRLGRRLLHPWRSSHWEKLSRRNWVWWFDEFWFHHNIRLICWWELHRHGYTWRDARALLRDEPLRDRASLRED